MNSQSKNSIKEKRFGFGKNWQAFLSTLDEQRIFQAEKSLSEMLATNNFQGKKFIDIGSGSGLFSLAARRMGATVHSFDYDADSVACTQEIKNKIRPGDSGWKIEQGSALDEAYLGSLGKFDYVYSWGVLHHTGSMWKAIENAMSMVDDKGVFFISIYNDQGFISSFWWTVKNIYNSSMIGRLLVLAVFIPYYFLKTCLQSLFTGKNIFSQYKMNRGMSVYYDWIDWLGGFPFEVASVEKITAFVEGRGFILTKKTTTSGLGTNQFVFQKK